MQRRRLALLLLLMLAVPLTAGCWDRREVEETAFVLAVGVDRGEKSLYTVTLMIALPKKMAGGDNGGGDEEKPYLLATVEAPTVAEAIQMTNTFVDRKVSLIHAKAVFMGEELARISGLRTMDEFTRFRQARASIFYIVTRGKAGDFLRDLEPKMETNPNTLIEQLTYTYRWTGMLPRDSQIQSFVTTVNTGYGEPLTYYAAIRRDDEGEGDPEEKQDEAESKRLAGNLPRKGGPNVDMIGAAAFKNDRMVGVLTGDEMRAVLMMKDEFQRGFISVRDPVDTGQYISLDLNRGRPIYIIPDVTGPRPRIFVRLTMEAEVVAIQSARDWTQPARQRELEEAIGRELAQQVLGVIRKTQGWNADVVGFGRHVVKAFPTVAAWEAYDWPNRYEEAEVDVDVRVTIRRFGLQLRPPASSG